MVINEAIGDLVIGCYHVTEATLIWVPIECVDSDYLYDLAPIFVQWFTYFG